MKRTVKRNGKKQCISTKVISQDTKCALFRGCRRRWLRHQLFVLKSCSFFLPDCNKKCFNDAAAANEISAVRAEQYEAFNGAELSGSLWQCFCIFFLFFIVFGLTPCGWNRPQLWICGLWLRAADLQISALQTLDSLLFGATRLENTNFVWTWAKSVWHHQCSWCVFWPGELTCQVLESVWWRYTSGKTLQLQHCVLRPSPAVATLFWKRILLL